MNQASCFYVGTRSSSMCCGWYIAAGGREVSPREESVENVDLPSSVKLGWLSI